MAKVLVEKRKGLFTLQPLYGWLWGCIYPMLLDALLETGWEFVSVEQVHEYFKNMLAKDNVVNRHTGEIVEFPTSTATMDTLTFSTYCEKLREYGREYLGIDIPDPDKYWRTSDDTST